MQRKYKYTNRLYRVDQVHFLPIVREGFTGVEEHGRYFSEYRQF